MGFEPTTLCSIGESSTNWAIYQATQLVGVRIYNTTQGKLFYVYIIIHVQYVHYNRPTDLCWREAWADSDRNKRIRFVMDTIRLLPTIQHIIQINTSPFSISTYTQNTAVNHEHLKPYAHSGLWKHKDQSTKLASFPSQRWLQFSSCMGTWTKPYTLYTSYVYRCRENVLFTHFYCWANPL